ncbi:uncharacterized protein zgc:174888 [Anguilla anguilla]|uniref:Uncharacterized protein n=1 Tax=Anguilla anguilla TaxID=7936 RepID=A0A9D3S694_ANGAN|nr:uncharacterized protein zgc:174888 [Anguilla anguilla]KAG5856348.1 hypothetical protein ANANG_G00007050 [Anguilla anguilla]
MSRPVFILLSVLLVQGRGCDYFMKNLLSIMENEHGKFRKVFPIDYKVTHHYNDSLLSGSDPCRMVSVAYMLSDSWAQLRINLWEENIHNSFIMQLVEKLDNIFSGKLQKLPDPSVFPPVSSTPEALLGFTSAFFSTWLKERCPSPVEPCVFPSPTSFHKEGKRSNHAPFNATLDEMEGGKRPQRSEVPPTSLATTTHPSYIFWCFPLLWTVL